MKKVVMVICVLAMVGMAMIGSGCSPKKTDAAVRETVVYPDCHIEYLDEIEVIPITVNPITISSGNITTWDDVTTWENILTEEVLVENVIVEEVIGSAE